MTKKSLQRRVNRVVRRVNRSIAKDTLWRGRFVIRQLQAFYGTFDDGSGIYATYAMQFTDLKTGKSKVYWCDHLDFTMWNGNKIFWNMNKFITEDCDIWRTENPYDDRTVYRLK